MVGVLCALAIGIAVGIWSESWFCFLFAWIYLGILFSRKEEEESVPRRSLARSIVRLALIVFIGDAIFGSDDEL